MKFTIADIKFMFISILFGMSFTSVLVRINHPELGSPAYPELLATLSLIMLSTELLIRIVVR